jgi:hypothetical protein
MQYRRREVERYLAEYVDVFRQTQHHPKSASGA